jgi:3-dehydroquinate synthase
MRGITLIAIPTTLLSMVDSSIGGKTAIDLPAGKNLLGTFYQPNAVYIDIDFIKTLSEREITSGYGEIIKYAFLDSKITKQRLDKEIDESLIEDLLKIKKDIVERDELESDLRKLLNLGHTFGHAIEKLSSYTISHGECVLKGIKYAIEISKKVFGIKSELVNKALDLLMVKGEVTNFGFTSEELIEQIKNDKKSDHNGVDFVLIKGIGEPVIKHLTFDELHHLIDN